MDSASTDNDAEWSYLCKRRTDLKIRSLTNRIYQQERQRIMELREGAVKAASLIAGSVALFRLVDPQILTACLAVIFVGTACSLVFSWGTKARDAAKRASEWMSLDRDIEAAGERTFTEPQLDGWSARCNEIESGEPAPNKVLLERSYLRACEALGCEAPEGGPRFAGWRPVLLVP
jgi:hypothetical protein